MQAIYGFQRSIEPQFTMAIWNEVAISMALQKQGKSFIVSL